MLSLLSESTATPLAQWPRGRVVEGDGGEAPWPIWLSRM